MLPILEDVDPAHCMPAMPVKMEQMKSAVIPDTRSLLKEFETVLDAVEMTHGTFEQLTPPQSPPYEQPILTTLETIPAQPLYHPIETKQPQAIYHVPERQNMLPYPHSPLNISLEYPVVSTPQPDVARELAVVEELVRSRVEDMVQWSGPSSPSSSSSSNFGDCSSDDPEWIPEALDPQPDLNLLAKTPRKRVKPYSRTSTEDKKSRKKEQNKNAATRYRLKKKAEVEEILEEERNLQKKNEELENKIGDVQREIKYLKGLMRDLFKAKGLIN